MTRLSFQTTRGALSAAFTFFTIASLAMTSVTMAMGQRDFPPGDELPSIDPTGTRWIITQAHDTSWMPSDQVATIEFTEDAFFGRAPCNSFRGPRQDGGLSPFIMSTRAACDRLDIEGLVLNALKDVREMRFNACHGIGLDEKGQLIVSFYRETPPQICETTRM